MSKIIDLPWEEYIADGYLGSSALHAWGAKECGREAWAEKYLVGGYGKSPANAAMVAGSALDCWLTAGQDAFAAKYVKAPDGLDFRTKEGKEWKAANAGKDVLDGETFAQIEESVRRVSNVLALMGEDDPPQFQATMRGEVHGVKVQTRPDILFPESKWLRDLKYVNANSMNGFSRSFVGSRYFIQAALFAGLTDFDYKVSFLLVESGTMAPRIQDIEVPERILRAGWRKIEAICQEIKRTEDSPWGFNEVPTFSVLEIPAWAEKEIEV